MNKFITLSFRGVKISHKQLQEQFDSFSQSLRKKIYGLDVDDFEVKLDYKIFQYKHDVEQGNIELKIKTGENCKTGRAVWSTRNSSLTPLLEEYKDTIYPALEILRTLRQPSRGLKYLTIAQFKTLAATGENSPFTMLAHGTLGATDMSLPLRDIKGHKKVLSFERALHKDDFIAKLFSRNGEFRFPNLLSQQRPLAPPSPNIER